MTKIPTSQYRASQFVKWVSLRCWWLLCTILNDPVASPAFQSHTLDEISFPVPKKKSNTESKEEPLEKQLWKAADKLRKNIDAAEYKHVVLGLIFLKYISDSFEEMFNKLTEGMGEYAGADPEDKDEYSAENVFFVPPVARWSHLLANAKQPTIGIFVDEAMDAIEKENPLHLKGVLPKVYTRQNLDPTSLGELMLRFRWYVRPKRKVRGRTSRQSQRHLDLWPREQSNDMAIG